MSNYIYTNDGLVNVDELIHYGVPGMKWGHRKQQRLENKLARNIRRQTKADTKLLDRRAKGRMKLEDRFDRKIERAKNKNGGKDNAYVKEKRKEKIRMLKDFDAGTEGIKKAQKIKNENYNKIIELKAKSISDPSIKKTTAYKKAKAWSRAQRLSDSFYGKDYTLLMETSYALTQKGRSWTRGYTG